MIHVLTLNWNGYNKLQNLRRTLQLNLKTLGIEHKWHIRDNGSDNCVTHIKEWNWPAGSEIPLQLHEISHNRDNFAQGMNYLVKAAQAKPGDFYLFLNNDVDFRDETSLLNMFNLMTHKNLNVVGAKLVYPDGARLQHAGVIFGDRYGRMPYHYRHQEKSDDAASLNRRFQAVTAAVCLVRADAFPGMDERFSWAFDDIDMCLTINEKFPGSIGYCGATHIMHEESASLKKNPVNKLFLNNNVQHFKRKWTGKYEIDHEKYLKDPKHNLL